MSTLAPKGFKTLVKNVGIKDTTKDFVCIFSTVPCAAAGVFTQNLFVGPSVTLSKNNIQNGKAQAIVTISKNANVANGQQGEQDAYEVTELVAKELAIPVEDVLIASTGVIGRLYPMEKIRLGIQALGENLQEANIEDMACGIMTTDTVPKFMSVSVGNAVLAGVAKGVGMIEPNMATLLVFFITDAQLDSAILKSIFTRVMDRTFNCLSIDTDTSTSDTALILANGLAGPVDITAFEQALEMVSIHLVQQIAKDGEGATKMIEVVVSSARDDMQAKRVAKSIVNSPLVKTAIHGADPNWGRIAMAIGKCSTDTDIDPDKTVIRFGEFEVYPKPLNVQLLDELSQFLQQKEIQINIELNIGKGKARVWGCDLSAEYVKINGEYTT